MATIREAQAAKRAVRRTICQLHEAITRNDISQVSSLVTDSVDVNFHYKGQSALQIAVSKGYYGICDFLIKKGSHVNKCNAEMNSLLNMACWRGYDDIALLLIQNYADVNQSNDQGFTPLNTACLKGQTGIAGILTGHPDCDLNKINNRGHTPLMTCVRTGHMDIGWLLIEAGCELDIGDEDLRTPLLVAANKGNFEDVKMLVSSGCDVNFKDKRKYTALFEAASNGHVEIGKTLLAVGANANAQSNRGVTPLLEAVMREHKEMAKILIRHGCNLNLSGHLKQTPLHVAVRQAIHYFGSASNGTDMVRELVEAGCDVNLGDNEGWRPIYQSAFGGDISITKFLLSHKANIHVQTHSGDYLIHGAVYGNKLEIVNLVIEAGCDVNAVNNRNELPLYLAVASNSQDVGIIKALIDAGSQLDICENSNRNSPLMAAIQYRFTEAVKLLVDSGCDVNLENASGSTPLYEVCEKGDELMLSYLLASPKTNVNGTPSHIPLLVATKNGFHGIVQKLLEGGCHINIFDNQGCNAMFYAADSNNMRIVRMLLKWGFNLDSIEDMPKPRPCCQIYEDKHPHLELDPLYAAVKHDNPKMLILLLNYHYKMPYRQLDLLQGLVFHTNYIQESHINQRLQNLFRDIFNRALSQPLNLQKACRGAIRCGLGERPHLKVDSLPVPAKIKEFIMMTDHL